ncbi:MAG: DUF4166 domain-containing protein [Anaerolineae bacterium]|nr:DUF4166 domain-containing protein [Anaerolineae bacterium]
MSSRSLYRTALGPAFDQLHPAIQRHYDLTLGQRITLHATMRAWNRLAFAQPLMPFTPKPGDNLPTTVINTGVQDAQGRVCFEWQRNFTYPKGQFNNYTLTTPPPQPRLYPVVMDRFAGFPQVALELALEVAEGGNVLNMRTQGGQYLVFGQRLLPLPRFMHMVGVGVERAIGPNEIEISIRISHPLVGELFGYAGRATVGLDE